MPKSCRQLTLVSSRDVACCIERVERHRTLTYYLLCPQNTRPSRCTRSSSFITFNHVPLVTHPRLSYPNPHHHIVVQQRYLIPVLNARQAQAYYTTARPIVTHSLGHRCMNDLTSERGFESQATCVIGVLGLFLGYP